MRLKHGTFIERKLIKNLPMQLISIPLKSFLFFFVIIVSTSSFAQDKFEVEKHFKPFEVDLGMGYARPQGQGSKAGVLLYIEPRYNLLDKLSLGIKTEVTAMARGFVDVGATQLSGDAGLSLSFLATGEYYFTNHLVRPFIGAGGGIYNLVGVNGTTSGGGSVSIPAVTKFGGMARAGLEIWHIRGTVEYNYVGKTGAINNNYIGLKVGIVLGGGKYDSEDE
jgi:hypothetical protein